MKLQWVRLANGFHYAPTTFVQVGRHSSSGPVVVRTPLERDENFEDGWLWSDVVDSERQADAYFNNIPDAKAWVESHLPLLRAQTNWDYDSKPRRRPQSLSPNQLQMLRSVSRFGHTRAYLYGMAAHGGAAHTRTFLEDRGLIQRVREPAAIGVEAVKRTAENEWELTEAGRIALETCRG